MKIILDITEYVNIVIYESYMYSIKIKIRTFTVKLIPIKSYKHYRTIITVVKFYDFLNTCFFFFCS